MVEAMQSERSSVALTSSDSDVDNVERGPAGKAAGRSSDAEGQMDYLSEIKSYDARLDAGGRSRCTLLERIGACLDACAFPPQIRPLPCLRRKGCCNRCCEANRFCFCLARQGIQCMSHLRKLLLLVCTWYTCISIVLRGLPAASLQTDRASMQEYPWAYGKYTCLKPETCSGLEARIMIGLNSLLVISDRHNMRNSIEWGSEDCELQLGSLGIGEYCSVCRNASLGCAAVALLSIATGLVNLYTDIQRMRARNDHNFAKNLAFVSNVIGALQQLFAVSIFHGLCVREFPLEDAASTFRVELEMGSGGALLASAAALNMFGIAIHFIIPVPEARWRVYGYVSERDPAPGEWPSVRKEAFAGALPDPDAPTLLSSNTLRGDGPGWDDRNRMMVRRSHPEGEEKKAADEVADVPGIVSACGRKSANTTLLNRAIGLVAGSYSSENSAERNSEGQTSTSSVGSAGSSELRAEEV